MHTPLHLLPRGGGTTCLQGGLGGAGARGGPDPPEIADISEGAQTPPPEMVAPPPPRPRLFGHTFWRNLVPMWGGPDVGQAF